MNKANERVVISEPFLACSQNSTLWRIESMYVVLNNGPIDRLYIDVNRTDALIHDLHCDSYFLGGISARLYLVGCRQAKFLAPPLEEQKKSCVVLAFGEDFRMFLRDRGLISG